jgi:hypothetical protein
MDYFIFNCPHCNEIIFIYKNEINCKIFRHGIYKKNYEQINPHLDENNCDKLIKNNDIFGCGKPFQLIQKDDKYEIIICDYI